MAKNYEYAFKMVPKYLPDDCKQILLCKQYQMRKELNHKMVNISQVLIKIIREHK